MEVNETMFGRRFFIGRLVGLMLLGFGLLFGLGAAFRAGQMSGYRMGMITAYQETARQSEGSESAPTAPFMGRGYDRGMHGGWGMRPHFGFGFFPFLCLIPLGFLFLGGFFFRRRWHHHHSHGPMGAPWEKQPGKDQAPPADAANSDPDETVYKA